MNGAEGWEEEVGERAREKDEEGASGWIHKTFRTGFAVRAESGLGVNLVL